MTDKEYLNGLESFTKSIIKAAWFGGSIQASLIWGLGKDHGLIASDEPDEDNDMPYTLCDRLRD